MTTTRRFLAAQARAGNGHGYTTQPQRPLPATPQHPHPPELLEQIRTHTTIADEPEAISPAILNTYAESASYHQTLRHQRDLAQLRQIRPGLPPTARLQDIHRRAKHQHINLRPQLHAAQHLHGQTLLEHIETMEAILDGPNLPLAAYA